MMVSVIAIGALIGAALGLRFKVPILVPTIALASVGTTAVGIARGGQFWSVVVAVILIGAGIQIGYLVGIVTRVAVTLVRERAVTGVRKLRVS